MTKYKIDGNVKKAKIGKIQFKLKNNMKIEPVIKDNQKLMHIQHDKSLARIGCFKQRTSKNISKLYISDLLNKKLPILDESGE